MTNLNEINVGNVFVTNSDMDSNSEYGTVMVISITEEDDDIHFIDIIKHEIAGEAFFMLPIDVAFYNIPKKWAHHFLGDMIAESVDEEITSKAKSRFEEYYEHHKEVKVNSEVEIGNLYLYEPERYTMVVKMDDTNAGMVFVKEISENEFVLDSDVLEVMTIAKDTLKEIFNVKGYVDDISSIVGNEFLESDIVLYDDGRCTLEAAEGDIEIGNVLSVDVFDNDILVFDFDESHAAVIEVTLIDGVVEVPETFAMIAIPKEWLAEHSFRHGCVTNVNSLLGAKSIDDLVEAVVRGRQIAEMASAS